MESFKGKTESGSRGKDLLDIWKLDLIINVFSPIFFVIGILRKPLRNIYFINFYYY